MDFLKISGRFFAVMMVFISGSGAAQTRKWTAGPFSQKVFIENNRQWDGQINGRTKILFGTSQQGIDIYWRANGLTYKITQYYVREGIKKEGNRERWKEHVRAKYQYLSMEWVNSNLSAQVIGEEPVSNYFTYSNLQDRSGKSGISAQAYKKITYKNIYPGIDAQYILPEDKEGIKYSFIVHPGADPGLIKIQYNGADKININSLGEIEIHSARCGDYIEHQPASYYQDGTPVESGFVIQDETIGFTIPEYDKSKTLIIDPWVSIVNFPPGTNPSASAYNTSAYDVGYDNAGNVWVYGGADPVYLSKYNSAGTLLWTYSVPFSAWDLVGDFDVHKITGTAYISAGSDCTPANPGGLPAGIVKVNSQGMQTGRFNGNPKNREISRIRIDCTDKLYVTGGGIQAGLWQVGAVDTNLTTMTGAHITASPNGDHDECLMALDPTGNFMYMNFNRPAMYSVDFLHDNEMQKIPLPAYTPAVWVNPGPIYDFVEMGSLPYAGIADGMTPPNGPSRINMFNGMACGKGFLYTYNGTVLKQWNKNTGTLIKQVTTGGTKFLSGGLELDLCENVYAGVSDKVLEYDSTFTIINTYPLPSTTCYDIKIDKNNNLLYACGKGYVCAIPLGGTGPIKTFNTTGTPAACNDCNGTAAATFSVSTTACGTAFNYSYKWLPGGQTTPSISNLCPGTYTVIAAATQECYPVFSDTGIVVVTGGSGIVAAYSNTAVCFNNPTIFTNSSIGISSTTQWQWNFGDGNTSTVKDPIHTYSAPGSFTVTLIATDSSGCNDTIQHPVFVNPLPVVKFSSSPVCIGDSTCFTDASTVTPGTITGWSWNFGEPASGAANISALQNPCHIYNGTGPFTVILTITSDSGCQNTTMLPVNTYPLPTAVIIPKNGCLNSLTSFTDGSTAGGAANSINAWDWNFGDGTPHSTMQNPSHLYAAAGTYTVNLIVTTVNGCKDSANSTVIIYPPPVANFTKPVKGCSPVIANYTDLSTVINGTIGSWQWSFPGGTPSSSTVQNPANIMYTAAGTYSVSLFVTTGNGCRDSIKLPMVEVYPWPTADFTVVPSIAPATSPHFNFSDLWSAGVTHWVWDFGDGSPLDSTNTDPVHSYSATANQNDFYQYDICIRVQNLHGCWDTTCHPVELIPEFTFYIPNTFTPNGDPANETFFGKSRGVKEYSIWLFDRWGNLIWDCHRQDKNTNWDNDYIVPRQEGLSSACQWDGVVVKGGMDMSGNSRDLAQEDVYVWKVKLVDIFDKRHTYIGHVNIIR